MLTAYIFSLVVGGGLLASSFFGDFLEGDADMDADMDAGADGTDAAKLLSLRTVVYTLFGFGAAGAALHWLWGGTRPGVTALAASATGLASGALISTVFGYLKRTDSGEIPEERSFIGLTGKVVLEIAPGSPGEVRVQRGERMYRIRARTDDAYSEGESLESGQQVVVVDIKDGTAAVAPADLHFLND